MEFQVLSDEAPEAILSAVDTTKAPPIMTQEVWLNMSQVVAGVRREANRWEQWRQYRDRLEGSYRRGDPLPVITWSGLEIDLQHVFKPNALLRDEEQEASRQQWLMPLLRYADFQLHDCAKRLSLFASQLEKIVSKVADHDTQASAF